MNLSEALDAALPDIPRARLSRKSPPRIDPDLIIREDVVDGESIVSVYQRSTANLLRMKPTQWQLAGLFDGVRTYQEIAAAFQAQTGIVATDGRLDIENARLSELSSQLVSIQALRQDSASRQRQINGDPESMPEVLQSQVIGSLKGDLSRAEAKLHDIATNLGKNHPDYQNTAAEIAGLKQRIADESARIAASLSNNTQVMMRRENDIRAALDAQKKRMLDLTKKRMRYASAGVVEAWYVDLDMEIILVYRLQENAAAPARALGRGDALASALLPGFEVAASAVIDAE